MSLENDNSSDSDYFVENYIRPDKITKPYINDESADILGNFDNSKTIGEDQLIDPDGTQNYKRHNTLVKYNDEYNHFVSSVSMLSDDEDNNSEENNDNDEGDDDDEQNLDISRNTEKTNNGKLTIDQIKNLLRGASKSNRYVLYVTNLNFNTTKDDLMEYFSNVGQIKSIRIPKKSMKRKNSFAFIEMLNLNSFQNALQLHNTILNERQIKIQISEGGKKKSANKKNILKQKNRKLAEMRNEYKCFTKSGKNYDKDIKKEKLKEYMEKTKWWRKKGKGGKRNIS